MLVGGSEMVGEVDGIPDGIVEGILDTVGSAVCIRYKLHLHS